MNEKDLIQAFMTPDHREGLCNCISPNGKVCTMLFNHSHILCHNPHSDPPEIWCGHCYKTFDNRDVRHDCQGVSGKPLIDPYKEKTT